MVDFVNMAMEAVYEDLPVAKKWQLYDDKLAIWTLEEAPGTREQSASQRLRRSPNDAQHLPKGVQ
jgi:hypothetical protein